MNQVIHLDFETKSMVDIRKSGAFRYAEDASTDILCAALALNDEPPVPWVNPLWEGKDDGLGGEIMRTHPRAHELKEIMAQPDTLVCAHNVQFEAAITHYQGARHGFKIHSLANWRCSAALCRRANIPASLEKAAETLRIRQQKDKRGHSLIQKFSIPQKKTGRFIRPDERPEDFNTFIEYCLQDVRVEQEIDKLLHPAFKLAGPVLETFILDLNINMRGLAMNMQALRHAHKLIVEEEEVLTNEFVSLTGFNPGQNKVLLTWLQDHGYKGSNLQAVSLEEEFSADDFDPDSLVGRVLTLKKALSFASIKKVKAMIGCACSDGRARGTLQFHGAATMRWSGKILQPQNMKRPTIKHTHAAYDDICAGADASFLKLMYGPLLEVFSSCIRHFIHDIEAAFYDIDYSSIEARILAWLAGEEWKLEVFRTHGKIYEATAARMTGVSMEEMEESYQTTGKHHPNRLKGKVAELALGYQGAVGALEKMGALKMGLEKKDLPDVVKSWRKVNSNIRDFWYDVEKGAKTAIKSPGYKAVIGKIAIFCASAAGSNYMFMQLPSGRRMAYRDPQVSMVNDLIKGEDGEPLLDANGKKQYKLREKISYWGQIDGKAAWGRVFTYGGSLVENCLAYDTRIVTNRGVIQLGELQDDDLVWDGYDFVSHDGLINQGVQEVMDLEGITCTHDHRFWTEEGWTPAKSVCLRTMVRVSPPHASQRSTFTPPFKSNRNEVRTFDGFRAFSCRWKENSLECSVRLWKRNHDGWQRNDQVKKEKDRLQQALPSHHSFHQRSEEDTRYVETPSVRSVAFNEAALHGLQPPCIQELRRPRYHGVQRMADFIRVVLGSDGADVEEGVGSGPSRQQRRILTSELPVGDTAAEHPQHKGFCDAWQHPGHGDHQRNWAKHSVLENSKRSIPRGGSIEKARCYRQVYDIRNCGPRSQFAVVTREGFLVLAHNCCQAIAFDVMANGACKAEKAGFEIATLIHDQCLVYNGNKDRLEELRACLLDLPRWADGLPIDAKGDITPYYTKD